MTAWPIPARVPVTGKTCQLKDCVQIILDARVCKFDRKLMEGTPGVARALAKVNIGTFSQEKLSLEQIES